jgi:hypothetical protein|tara:strand:- start:100 stop:582 length:483 start_codon:yes stop_codon:yes gene_type:complete
MNKVITFILALIIGGLLAIISDQVFAADTNITTNNKGMPVPSAIAPSISTMNPKICKTGVSGGANTGVVSISGGFTVEDENCARVVKAETLSNLGLKVSAVSLMCQDESIWEAMEMASSPCPFGGALGDVARRAWFKRYPERFYKLYGSDFKFPVIADKQ